MLIASFRADVDLVHPIYTLPMKVISANILVVLSDEDVRVGVIFLVSFP